MQTTAIPSLNHTVEETHNWLQELASDDAFVSEDQAYSILRAVLHAIRDRLTVDEVAHLGSQLPMVVRGFYFEGWRPALAPNDERTVEEFLDHVRSSLPGAPSDDDVDLRRGAPAVMRLLENHISEGQIQHVCDQLPEAIDAFLRGRTPS